MKRVTPDEPFNPEPEAAWLREASRPGPVFEDPPSRCGLGWLLLAVAVIFAVAILSGCSSADAAQEPGASVEDMRRAAAGAWQCPGMHAEWVDDKTVQCLKERP